MAVVSLTRGVGKRTTVNGRLSFDGESGQSLVVRGLAGSGTATLHSRRVRGWMRRGFWRVKFDIDVGYGETVTLQVPRSTAKTVEAWLDR